LFSLLTILSPVVYHWLLECFVRTGYMCRYVCGYVTKKMSQNRSNSKRISE